MTMNRARYGLLAIFALGLGIQVAAFFSVSQRMWPEDLQALIIKLLGLYSVPFGVILGGMFAQPKERLKEVPGGIGVAALLVAILWNSLLVWRTLSFRFATQDSATAVIQYMEAVSGAGAFLVAGMLAFFFGKGTAPVTGDSKD